MDINMLRRALWVFLKPLLLLVTNLLSPEVGEEWLAELKRFLRKEPCWVVTAKTVAVVKKTNRFFRRLYDTEIIEIGATDGTKTFRSSGVFPGGVYGETLPSRSKPTEAVKVSVWEMLLDGIFAKLFGSFGSRRKRGVFTEHQVIEFCRKYHDKLRTDGYGTFFELEGGFVAYVHVRGGGLEVRVLGFSYGGVWGAEDRDRFVIPQLEL